jgi:hypothetical protein
LLNTLSVCYTLNTGDHVLHPHKTSGKVRVPYILIYMFLDRPREDRSSRQNCSKNCQNSVST